MRIVTLHLSCFRNISAAQVSPGPCANLLVGGNGQGKTNFVEAVTFLSWMRSFRTARTADLLMHGCDAAFIEAEVAKEQGTDHAEVTIGKGFRKAVISGRAVRSARQCMEAFPVVCMSPEDPAVLNGGPEGRRLLVDRLAGTLAPACMADFSRYDRLVHERNRFLKYSGAGSDPILMAAQEEALASAGAEVGRIRHEAVGRLMESLPNVLKSLAGDDMEARVTYRPAWRAEGLDDASALLGQIRARRAADLAIGYTGVGPHADDVSVEILGHRARGLASRGQLKILLLAWKAAQADLLARVRGMAPVLVLDDVLADLDLDRQERVFRFLANYQGQSFLTSPVPMTGPGAGAAVFEVRAGLFQRVG